MIDYNSSLLQDVPKSEGVYSFTPDDLFDRVINLKLTAYEKKDGQPVVHDEYIIRSDWEMYYPDMNKVATGELSASNLNKCYIRRCIQKPSIKVQYKQISSGTAIEIDIFISNFTMMSADGRTLMAFNNITYPLGQVEIQMGYFGQFNKKPETFEEYFDFSYKPNVDTITVNVAYVQTDSLPPDGVLHIHGYVGSCYNPPLALQKKDKVHVKTDWQTLTKPALKYYDYLKDYLFTNVTRRFIRKAVSAEEVAINKDSGLMSLDDAEKYGVKVFPSEKLAEACKKELKRKEAKTADGTVVEKKVIGHYSESVVQALNMLRDDLGIRIGFKALNDGNYIIFLMDEVSETEKNISSLTAYKNEDKNLTEAGNAIDVMDNILPAVSNITTDALCTIVCPFFYFINPFDKLKFKSRYALGGVVTYYADFSVKESEFYALYMTVSFATVDDINECTIVCTGKKEGINGQ